MTTELADFLTPRIQNIYGSNRAFVRATEPSGSEESAASYLSKILRGERPPQFDRLDTWCTALQLGEREIVELRRLFILAYLPADVRPEISKVFDEVDELKQAFEDLKDDFRRVADQNGFTYEP